MQILENLNSIIFILIKIIYFNLLKGMLLKKVLLNTKKEKKI